MTILSILMYNNQSVSFFQLEEAKAEKVLQTKCSKAIPSTSTFRNSEVPTVNTIDAVIVECPTKHEASDDQTTEVLKPHPAI